MRPDDRGVPDEHRAPGRERTVGHVAGWPLAIVGLLVISASVQLANWYVASHHPTLVVEADYYQRALSWDARVAAERREEQLGWQVEVVLARTGKAEPEARLEVRLRDSSGVAIEDASVLARLFHRAHPRQVLVRYLSPIADGGYGASVGDQRAGLWRIELVVNRGSDRLTDEQDVVLAVRPG